MQLMFGDAEDLSQRKQTRREMFLAQMDSVVPWQTLLKLIAPHYPTLGRPSRQRYALATMLRIHIPAAVVRAERPCDGRSPVRHAGDAPFRAVGWIGRGTGRNHDPHFRRLLETHGVAVKMLAKVNAHLSRAGLSLRAGTIVDATIIAAPSSTKNQDGERDPETHQTKKGNQCRRCP